MTSNTYILCFLSIWTFIASTAADESILGGSPAQFRYFTYYVALLHDDKPFCGGSIIGKEFVLTAARCVVNDGNEIEDKPIFALAGTNDLSKLSTPAVKIPIKKIYVPTEYISFIVNAIGDIAVLKLKEPFQTSMSFYSNFRSLSLPRNNLENFVNKHARISGYGWSWTHHGEGGHNDTQLRYANVRILDPIQHHCPGQRVHDKQICAKILSQHDSVPYGSCTGDEGGPLVYDGYLVVGVINQIFPGCAEGNAAASYTRVSAYLTFIHNAKNDKVTKYMKTRVLSTETN